MIKLSSCLNIAQVNKTFTTFDNAEKQSMCVYVTKKTCSKTIYL